MKVAVIGTVGIPANYGGFETLVENIVSDEMVVYCSSKSYPKKMSTYKGASLCYIPLKANGIQSILYDIISIIHAIRSGHKKLLILGVSGAIVLPLIKFFYRDIFIVTNIDGLEWKRAKWTYLVKRYLKFCERLAVKFSNEVISDNQAIADYVAEEYSKQSHVIAYGGDHAICKELSNYSASDFALAVCRIEPENNVELILKACAQANHTLVFVGNWAASSYGRGLKARYGAMSGVKLLDPIYDIDKLGRLRAQCALYIHGHSAGGTNPSLVEFMHFNKPILSFDCAYNRATLENKGIYFSDVDSLVAELTSQNYASMKFDFKEVADRLYRWEVIRANYRKCLGI